MTIIIIKKSRSTHRAPGARSPSPEGSFWSDWRCSGMPETSDSID